MKEKKFHEKMFITDLDGTLFTDGKKINVSDLESLEYLGEMGVVRVFATGRSLYSFQKAVKDLGFSPFCEDLPVDYLIFSTGAGIIDCTEGHSGQSKTGSGTGMRNNIVVNGNIIRKHSLEPADVSRIADYLDSLGLDYMVHRPVPDSHYCIYRHRSGILNPDFNMRIEIYGDFVKPVDYPGSISDFGEATELLTIVPAEYGHKTADMIQQALPEFSVVRATSPLDGQSVWVEVFNSQVSKSQSVSWLAGELGIRQCNVAAIGNDYNDLDMLEWSGHGFVVRNAPEALRKRFADREKFTEVASNNDCGVSEAVSCFRKTAFQDKHI